MFAVVYFGSDGWVIRADTHDVATVGEAFAIATAVAASSQALRSFEIWADGQRLIATADGNPGAQ